MALFFKTFRHNSVADAMGIPVFPLSKNELKHQAKYEDDIYSLSDGSSVESNLNKGLDRFVALDLNRQRRKTVLLVPPKELLPDELKDTEKRSNMAPTREEVRKSIRMSIRMSVKPAKFHRSTSDVDEVMLCLDLAKQDFHFDQKTSFHRKSSGELTFKTKSQPRRSSLLFRNVSQPMMPTDETRANLGKVHYQLAVLHGMGRFPEVVPNQLSYDNPHDIPPHDAFSVLFHLSHAASLNNVPACLALGRVHAGLPTMVSGLLESIAPIDFDAAKDLLRRAMESPFPPAGPKAAAGCLLYQIHVDEGDASPETLMTLLKDTIALIEEFKAEQEELKNHLQRQDDKKQQGLKFHIGDKVEANYCLEGTFYPGVVDDVSEDGETVVVKYNDDGSTESHKLDNVRMLIPPTATQTGLGGPLSDEEALGVGENSDERCLMEGYELKAELAELKEQAADLSTAAKLYEEAADGAMTAGKMKKATEWSLKASELQE